MAIVSPSILSADFGKLGADCRMVLDAGAQMLHYDVMDGHFVPNISFSVPVLKSLHKNLPDAFYDVHLMISHPLQYAEAFIKAGATLYNFHLECEDDIQATIDAVQALGCKVGLTIKPGTEPQALAPYLDQLDLVLVMSVEPGFGGQKFMPRRWTSCAGSRQSAKRAAHTICWKWTAAWTMPPRPSAWKRALIFWWRAVQCSAQQTLLQPCSTSPAFERITIYG